MTTALASQLAEALKQANTDVAFGVPGGGPNLDIVDAMADKGIRFVLTHSETAACIIASTYGLITGRTSPVVVTRGPGAASAVNGAAQATLDRQSLVLITDTVPSSASDRVPHQRIDQRAMFAPVCVGSITLEDQTSNAALAEVIAEASRWPRGTVHIDYNAASTTIASPGPTLRSQNQSDSSDLDQSSTADAIDKVKAAVSASRKPVIILGVAAIEAASALRPTIAAFGAPVLSTYQATGIVGSEDDLFGGLFTNGAAERALLSEADLIVAVGLDMVEPIPAAWTYDAPVVSLSPTPTTDPYLPIEDEAVGDIGSMAAQILTGSHEWSTDAGAHHRETVRHLLLSNPLSINPPMAGSLVAGTSRAASDLSPVELVQTVASHAPATVTACVDAGAHFLAIMPFWNVDEPNRLLISNGLATMGYSVPAAIGAALARPGEPVISFVGDGGLGMSLAELETVARLDLPITVIVFNDATLSLIDIKQHPDHSGRAAVDYTLTDFAAAARSFGLAADVVRTASELGEILLRDWMKPRVIDARIDPTSYRHLIKVTRGG